MRESVISDMYFLFRPKFWENLTSPLFGTLSPPSETSEVSGERRDSGGEALGVKAGLRLGCGKCLPPSDYKRPARFLHLKLLSQRSICLLSFEVLLLGRRVACPALLVALWSPLTWRHCGPDTSALAS